ncbi:MAG TPA: DNA gyrase subunit A [Anaerolineae bacterium]|nr:DNA gyrase subunit A [Anaerolineae bacterium]HOQ99713.1 DNA gyrase subunit A [Anaerolineae bacterium]
MEIGTVRQVSIVEQMRDAYLDYAMSVITARALPDVRDGLKPVQRRILYAMDDLSLRHSQPHKKSARIVGEVLGKYHPHGDAAVYDAMVRLAQDFSLRYPLVDGHGNFGSIDGDNAAAMRYTEARLAAIAEEMLADIDKDTVDFIDNFDGTLKEPRVLPARLPNLLVNGAAGIAVGMATNVPPHNLAEICDAVSYVIEHYDDLDNVTVEDLMQYVKGPDFPTGGSILGREGIVSAYATGKGRIVVRARAHIEDLKGGRQAIIVTELPYQVNKATLVERIADLVRTRKIETISDLRDESDRTGMRIVIELKRGSDTEATLNQLLKYTTMQTTFGVNMLALVDGEPRVLSLKRMLQLFVEHRREVITRRSRYELARAKQRAHILEGLKIALDNLDEVISIIRRSRDADTAQASLMRRFKLSEIQARAILDMQLRRLAALERKKIEEELAETLKLIRYLEDLLAHPRKVLALVQQEMADLRQEYGDARRTHIADEEATEFSAEDLIPSAEVLVVVTQHGYVRCTTARSFRARARALGAAPAHDEDAAVHVVAANSMDSALFFTDRGRVFLEKVHQVPDEARQARGVPLGNLVHLENGERVVGVVPVSDFERVEFVTLVTAQGKVKRSLLSEFSGARSSGAAAIGLDRDDALVWAQRTRGGQELLLATAQGKAIRFLEDEARPMGRTAGGVIAIRLSEGDRVAAVDVVREGGEVVLLTQGGHGKRTPLSEYAVQARGGAGVLSFDAARIRRSGPVVALRVVPASEELLLVSAEGMVLRVAAKAVPAAGRTGRSSQVMALTGGDTLVAVATIGDGGKGDPPPPAPAGGAAPEPADPPAKRGRDQAKTAPQKGAKAAPKARTKKAAAETGTDQRAAKAGAGKPKRTRKTTTPEEPAPARKPGKPAPKGTASPATKRRGSAGDAAAPATKKKGPPTATPRRKKPAESS